MRLTWRRQPSETGLARVCQEERGYMLNLDGECVASVLSDARRFGGDSRGYYWYAASSDKWPWRNTAAEGLFFTTIEEAKADCKEWIKAAITQAQDRMPR